MDTQELISAIENMTVLDLNNLVKAIEEKFGVTAAAPVMAAPATAAAPAEAAEEQTEFIAHLQSFGEKKIQVIKVIRALTGLGLKEAKDLVDGAPSVIKEGIPKDEAEKIKKDVEEAGGTVEIK